MSDNLRKILIVFLLAAGVMAGCGGGNGGSAEPSASPTRLIGEIIAGPEQLATSSLRANATYSGDVSSSRAAARAGNANLLDLLFLTAQTDPQVRATRLQRYITANADLLTPGIRVLVADEVYLGADTTQQLAQQWENLQAAIALVRQQLPQARVGITVSPYATINRPAMADETLSYIRRSIALVDWVATDPYWFGDAQVIAALHSWSSSFHTLAKQEKASVETWFVLQAFKFAQWDAGVFNQFIAQQMQYSEQYDHVILFGWQFVSDLDIASAGLFFAPDTRQLYARFLK